MTYVHECQSVGRRDPQLGPPPSGRDMGNSLKGRPNRHCSVMSCLQRNEGNDTTGTHAANQRKPNPPHARPTKEHETRPSQAPAHWLATACPFDRTQKPAEQCCKLQTRHSRACVSALFCRELLGSPCCPSQCLRHPKAAGPCVDQRLQRSGCNPYIHPHTAAGLGHATHIQCGHGVHQQHPTAASQAKLWSESRPGTA